MSSPLPDWLDPLVCLTDFDGDPKAYIEHLYTLFVRDFITTRPQFKDAPVLFDRIIESGKPRTFTHITTEEDRATGDRVLSLRRCERIGWIKAIIEHVNDPAILFWEKEHFAPQRKANRLYFFLECDNFLVIIEEKKSGHFMITAIYVDNPNQKRKHLKAYEEYRKIQGS